MSRKEVNTMLYKGKDTQREKVAQQKKYKDAFRVPDAKNGLLYHYAGIETIWKILEGDSFLARNIRFSNDAEEYRLGEKWIREYAKDQFADDERKKQFEVRLQLKTGMFYMICFCKEGDLLSQWRGYAKDGASLGMDFLEEDDSPQEHTEIFTVLNNENHREENRYQLDGEYLRFVEMPYQTFYVDGDEEDKSLGKAIQSFDDEDARPALLLNLIPFIKDKGFIEEAEYRILFDISDLGKTEAQNRKIMSRKIQYTERENRRLPNIAIEVGDTEKKEHKVSKIILGTEIKTRASRQGMKTKEIEGIYKEIESEIVKLTKRGTRRRKVCFNCERSCTKKHIYIGEGNNQEDIMACIEDVLQRYDFPIDCESGVKIWCRGHLPIREIIVGPGEKKEKLKESLKHYMQNVYWLRYVEVRDSKIPLQN